ncbi:MAG: hypothetical protein AB8G96_15415, partial [Phycisphaerales bacterium]
FTIDTTTGAINGSAPDDVNGVLVTFDGTIGGDIARFIVHGNLLLNADQRLRIVGGRAASILVAEDVIVHASATIDAAADGIQPGPGGGQGGTGQGGGIPNAPSVVPGVGGVPGLGGLGGAACFDGFDGFNAVSGGSPGTDAVPAIPWVSTGGAGEEGVNAPLSGGFPFIATLVPTVGNGGGGGSKGSGGSGGEGGDGDNGSTGGTGGSGGDGTNGGNGPAGVNGFPGFNTGLGGVLSGGGGGAGGGSGSGGGGGGSGGGGGGAGGGGGGGSFCQVFPPILQAGSTGGVGGTGGIGGIGGFGGAGGRGGDGGGGGGAVEIVAYGRLQIDGAIEAFGGTTTGVTAGAPGGNGASGGSGLGGVDGNDSPDNGGDGGRGGQGGQAGDGGDGGNGGAGGLGGGGAAGTIKLIASEFIGAGSLDLTPGNQDVASTGGPGRLLVGTTLMSQFAGTVVGGPLDGDLVGPTDTNPYVLNESTDTPLIVGLNGGNDVYGLTSLAPADVPGLLDAVPSTATIALIRLDELPAGLASDDAAHDAILIANIGDTDVMLPGVGVGVPDETNGLAIRGAANNPAFGGRGPVALDTLAPGEVWITLIPEAATAIALSTDAAFVSDAALADGGVIFLGGCTGDVDGSGDVGLADLLAVLAAWGAEGEQDADLDGDGIVALGDLLVVLAAWGSCG